MQMLSATEARKSLYQLVKQREPVEIQHKVGSMVLLPKEELEQMERDLVAAEMDRIIRSGQPKLTGQEVDALLAKALQDA